MAIGGWDFEEKREQIFTLHCLLFPWGSTVLFELDDRQTKMQPAGQVEGIWLLAGENSHRLTGIDTVLGELEFSGYGGSGPYTSAIEAAESKTPN